MSISQNLLTADSLIWSSDARRVRNPRGKGLVRLGKGLFVPLTSLDTNVPKWELDQQVQLARAIAVAANPNQTGRRLLTMEAALQLRGLPVWQTVGPIAYRTTSDRGRNGTHQLPEVVVRGRVVAPVSAHRVRGARLGTRIVSVRGVPTVSLEEAAVDLARHGHPLVAHVGVSTVLRELSLFDVFQFGASHAVEQQAKEQLIEMLGPIKGTRGYVRARRIIESADGAMESPPEGAVLWLIHVLLRRCRSPRARFESQYWVNQNANGPRVDIGFPGIRFYIEFDGRGKLIEDDRSAEAWQDRQASLLDRGWNAFRVSSKDLLDIESFAGVLAAKLKGQGLTVAPLGGVLWQPWPPPGGPNHRK